MKKHIALGLIGSTLLLAGCCATQQATKWEYKLTAVPQLPMGELNSPRTNTDVLERFKELGQKTRDIRQSHLNDLGKDGWVLVSENEGTFYFKRAVK